jgi:hypothetical protein
MASVVGGKNGKVHRWRWFGETGSITGKQFHVFPERGVSNDATTRHKRRLLL